MPGISRFKQVAAEAKFNVTTECAYAHKAHPSPLSDSPPHRQSRTWGCIPPLPQEIMASSDTLSLTDNQSILSSTVSFPSTLLAPAGMNRSSTC